jgi:hypothetical protein
VVWCFDKSPIGDGENDHDPENTVNEASEGGMGSTLGESDARRRKAGQGRAQIPKLGWWSTDPNAGNAGGYLAISSHSPGNAKAFETPQPWSPWHHTYRAERDVPRKIRFTRSSEIAELTNAVSERTFTEGFWWEDHPRGCSDTR